MPDHNRNKPKKDGHIPTNVTLPAAQKAQNPITGQLAPPEENLEAMRQWDGENQR